MKLVSYLSGNSEKAALNTPAGYLPIETISSREGYLWPSDLQHLLQSGRLEEVSSWYQDNQERWKDYFDCLLLDGHFKPAPLLRNPPKIIGIGLNYASHARDLSEKSPEEFPGSFMKPATTIIGHGDQILLPTMSEKITGEAELAMVIGRKCKDIPADKWEKYIAGFMVITDMTAEDILRKNPRFLTLSKSFDSFLSIGPELITPDEFDDIDSIRVETVYNGEIVASNLVSNMTFSPDQLLVILSAVMTLLPGDIILTGTPGAVWLKDGGLIEARVSGFNSLVNEVKTI